MALPMFKVSIYYVTEDATEEHPHGMRRRLLKVRCPRSNCRGVFVVPRGWKAVDWGHDSRPCPFCFRTARIPDGS